MMPIGADSVNAMMASKVHELVSSVDSSALLQYLITFLARPRPRHLWRLSVRNSQGPIERHSDLTPPRSNALCSS